MYWTRLLVPVNVTSDLTNLSVMLIIMIIILSFDIAPFP